MEAVDLDRRIDTLLHDAAEWRLLGRLLECPSPAWRTDVDALGSEMNDGGLKTAAEHARIEASEGVYHSVFGPGGPAPPREVSYHASLELGNLLSDLTGDYRAFGYEPDIDEPPDHIAVETGFVAYLRLKEAFACAEGDVERAEITREAATRFTSEHLARVAHPLSELLSRSGVEYLAQASALLVSRVGPKPAGRQLPVLQPNTFGGDEDGEMACEL